MLKHIFLVIGLIKSKHGSAWLSLSTRMKGESAAQDLISSTHVGDYFLQLAVMRLLLTCDIPWVDNKPSRISSPMFQINNVNVTNLPL